ncbi:hypothetical protein ABZ714_08800 [Streptomyces sp. NPDC006798]|uniref:hypothetical protein n=1 Tax=Streptomyces sp. NPDC006798 TaxID=3155462 RepID=UPI0033F8D2EB
MRRLDSGAPIRAAMRDVGLTIPSLAARTAEIDPDGLSAAYVGFIAGAGKTARDECSDRAARLIAAALDRPVLDLFEEPEPIPKRSTSTRRSSIFRAPEHLMTQKELAKYLRKSTSWIDKQIQDAKDRGTIWPGLLYVGESRRFDPARVLAAQQRQHQVMEDS